MAVVVARLSLKLEIDAARRSISERHKLMVRWVPPGPGVRGKTQKKKSTIIL